MIESIINILIKLEPLLKKIYNKLSEKPTLSGVGWIASPVGTIAKANKPYLEYVRLLLYNI